MGERIDIDRPHVANVGILNNRGAIVDEKTARQAVGVDERAEEHERSPREPQTQARLVG